MCSRDKFMCCINKKEIKKILRLMYSCLELMEEEWETSITRKDRYYYSLSNPFMEDMSNKKWIAIIS
jgi:hypothetical protein